MAAKITVVGTGPGHRDFLTFRGAEKIKEATVLVGGKRLLDTFARPGQERFTVDKNLAVALHFIKENYQRERLVVLVSGDTGIYSLASYLARELPGEILDFIPGISSVQLMFARLKRSWQNAAVLSVHGRPPDGLVPLVKEGNTVALLTGNQYTPGGIAAYLLREGCADCPVAVGKDLSYPAEKITVTGLQELAEGPEDLTPAVVVINYE